ELSFVPVVQAFLREIAVLAELHGAGGPEPDGVAAVDVDEVERVDDVAERLRDLAIVELEIPVHEELLRHVVVRGEQECGPEDAVETQDVLREQVSYSSSRRS